MSCAAFRKSWTAGDRRDLGGHRAACPTCARYAERIDEVRRHLRERRADVEPDGAFADRVVAALPRDAGAALGFAAARMLPATLALAVLLAFWAVATTPDPASLLVESPLESPLSWIAESVEEPR